jgi:hypothetical protein
MGKKINGHTLKPGVKVRVRITGGGERTGTVDYFATDIKNGMPGIDYTGNDGKGYWCYTDQILEIL